MTSPLDPRLDLSLPLRPTNAAAAILKVEGRYVLQLRDAKPGIFFPAQWGCFGGGVEANEEPEATLRRELEEELGLSLAPERFSYFTRFVFDLGFAGLGPIWRVFYHATLTPDELDAVVLGEGAAIQAFDPAAVLGHAIPITPYDAFALWFHINRGRLAE